MVAHFAGRDARSAETEMGGSDDGNAHINTHIDKSTNFEVGFLPLFGESE